MLIEKYSLEIETLNLIRKVKPIPRNDYKETRSQKFFVHWLKLENFSETNKEMNRYQAQNLFSLFRFLPSLIPLASLNLLSNAKARSNDKNARRKRHGCE